MNEFLTAALPWIIMGVAMALCIAHYSRKEKDDQ